MKKVLSLFSLSLQVSFSTLISFSLLLGKLSNPNPVLKALHSSSEEVFPKQGTEGRLHHAYKSAVTLECVNRHVSYFYCCVSNPTTTNISGFSTD